MTYIGQQPATTFDAGIQDRFTGLTTNTVTLSHEISAEEDILVVWNNIVQDKNTYSVGGTGNKTVTLGGTLASGDVVTVYYLNKVMQSVNPTAGSVGITELNVSDGSNGQALTTNGSGTLSFATVSADADNYFASSGLSSKDLGVGLHIKVADSSASVNNDGDDLVIENGESGIMAGMSILSATNGYGGISFGDSGSNTIGQMYYYHTNNSMHFKTNSVERLRLAGDGEVSINDSFADTNANGQFKVKGSLDETTCKFYHGSTSGSQNLFVFYDKDVENCGSISINASANTVAYNTSSDYRLKENETALTDGITRLKQLKPYRFNWKADSGGDKVDGFFAHEVSSIVPEAIHGEKDAMTTDDDGKTVINPQQIDQAKLVPLLTGALQEAITKIESLETRVKTLEDA